MVSLAVDNEMNLNPADEDCTDKPAVDPNHQECVGGYIITAIATDFPTEEVSNNLVLQSFPLNICLLFVCNLFVVRK